MKGLVSLSASFTLLHVRTIRKDVHRLRPGIEKFQFSRELSLLANLKENIREESSFKTRYLPGRLSYVLRNNKTQKKRNLDSSIKTNGFCSSAFIYSKSPAGKDSFFSRALNYKDHSYNTIRLDTDEMTHEELSDIADFTSRLILTIWNAKERGKTAIWFQVSAVHSHLISILQLHNFRYHHAHDTKALLYLWLDEERSDNIPSFATHNVGVGGLVLSKEKRVLLVKERYSPYIGWKLPGGLLDKGEEFGEAIQREVKEETGIDAYFQSILMIRHSHNVLWSNSDIYVLCKLHLGENMNEEPPFCIDENEISEAKWMSLHQFNREIEHPLLKKATSLALSDHGDLVEEEQKSMIGRKSSKMYYFQPK